MTANFQPLGDFMKLSAVLALVSLLIVGGFANSRASTGEPTAQLRATIDEFVSILVDTPVSELRSSGLPERALGLIHVRFDFPELTRRALGPHWRSLEPGEQREFVDAFTHRRLVAYGRTVRASGDEKVDFTRERLDGSFATVETRVLSSSGEVPIEYRMHLVDGQWRVYDMVIEHVSIVNNYRAQFERVIARSSVQGLLQRIKDNS
jgi:phospholipid transport system substrate-binding protein